MKTMKRIVTTMLTICLLVSCFSIISFAADGEIRFTDLETKVGETVEVKGVVRKFSGNFGKIQIDMKYDTSKLKFESGEGITESESGKLTYTGDATNDVGTEKEFKLTFKALQEGTAKIEITDSTIKNVSGTILDYEEGFSAIQIATGTGETTPTTPAVSDSDLTVDVAGVTYTISNEIPSNEIPEGYEASTLDYDGNQLNVVYSEEFELYLAYLVNEEYKGDFFMYVEEDMSFAPYVEIEISEIVRIALVSDVEGIVLPEEYELTTVPLGDYEFPAWRNQTDQNYCIVYAMTSNGTTALYQLDEAEGTFQRIDAPEVATDMKKDTWLGKLTGLLENHLDYVILGTGFGFILFLLIIVILSVKLYNRNAELDEIYEEYGLDDEGNRTEDDVMFDLDDEEEMSEEELDEAATFVQEGMREITAEELEEVPQEPEEEITVGDKLEEKKEEVQEEEPTLGKALKEVVAQQEEKETFDDDEIFENFSMDFIDLDD